jgi:tetratricopeptide (TPR) repeat protein
MKKFLFVFILMFLLSNVLFAQDTNKDFVRVEVEKAKNLILEKKYFEAKNILNPLFQKHVLAYYNKNFEGDNATGFYNLQNISFYLALLAFHEQDYKNGYYFASGSTGIIGPGWNKSWDDYFNIFYTEFEQSYKSDSKLLFDLYFLLSAVYNTMKDSKNELMFLNKAYKVNSESIVVTSMLASKYFELGDFEKSKDFYFNAIKLNPNDSEILSNASTILNVVGESQKGLELIKRAYELNPNDLNIRINLGLLLYVTDNSHEAENLYTETIKKFPENKELLLKASLYPLLDQKKFEKAISIVNDIPESSYYKQPVFAALIGVTYSFNNQTEKAKTIISNLIDKYPKAKEKEFILNNWSFRRNILEEYLGIIKQ